MAKTATKEAPAVDFERLSQQQAAKLIGKPAVWLRDHPQTRNSDGTYSLSVLIQSVAREFQPAKLVDADIERVRSITENATAETCLPTFAVVRYLRQLAETKGAPGMAAFGYAMLEAYEYWQSRESVEEIARQEAACSKADLTLQNLVTCNDCGRYRWGSRWLNPPIPEGWKSEPFGYCPTCLAK